MSPKGQKLIDNARKLAAELDEGGEDFKFLSRTLEAACAYLDEEAERQRLEAKVYSIMRNPDHPAHQALNYFLDVAQVD